MPVQNTYPFVVLLGRAEMDVHVFCLRTRLVVALQQRYGASFSEWTAPLKIAEMARVFDVDSSAVRRAVRDLVSAGYVQDHFVSTGRGNNRGVHQFRLVAPCPGWAGIGDAGEWQQQQQKQARTRQRNAR